MWANSVDASEPGRAGWALARLAVSLGATPGGPADVVLPDGRPAWCDGGPLTRHEGLGAVVHRFALEHGSLMPIGPNTTTAVLAPDQLAAVRHPGGVARIIAPAGSGKTRVLTERARLLLDGWGLPAGALCLVAFNKRAQEEMEARTTDLPALRVRTLNAARAGHPRRPAAVRAAAPRRLSTIDEPEVRRILGRLVKLPKRRNVDPLATWLEALSAARLGLRHPAAWRPTTGVRCRASPPCSPPTGPSSSRRGEVDFDEQIVRAIELLLADPAARHAAQRACRVLLVDELQDLTPAHVLLVRLVAAPGAEVFGVGDDDQTIYGYNGADPRWLIDFAHLFPGAVDHPLEVNYRCPEGVVVAARTLLATTAAAWPRSSGRPSTARAAGRRCEVDDPPARDDGHRAAPAGSGGGAGRRRRAGAGQRRPGARAGGAGRARRPGAHRRRA